MRRRVGQGSWRIFVSASEALTTDFGGETILVAAQMTYHCNYYIQMSNNVVVMGPAVQKFGYIPQ